MMRRTAVDRVSPAPQRQSAASDAWLPVRITAVDVGSAVLGWRGLQCNMTEAREVLRWLPPGGEVSPQQAFALAQQTNLRPTEAARLLGAPQRLSDLAGALQQAEQSNDAAALRDARKNYDDALTRVVLAARGLDATGLTGRGGALDQRRDNNGAPITTPTQRGQAASQPAPLPADPATPERVAEILRALPSQSYPNASVQILSNGVVRMTYTSQNAQRSLLVGRFSDLERLDPDIARQAGPFLTQRSALYQGRTAEYAGTSFRMADLSAVVLDDKGDVIGTGTLTYQTAAFGSRRQDAGGNVQIDNLQMRPVFFLAQVAGERGGGRQAVEPLLAIGRETKTNVVATTFPVNFWGANDRAGLYGPPPGTNPDFGVLWRVRGSYPTDQPYFFSPEQGSPLRPDGRSIFAGLPLEPDASDPADVATHDRVYYGWINDDVNGDGRRGNADIPLFVYSDHLLGDQIPGRNTSQGTRSYWVSVPSPTPERGSVLLPPPSNLPEIRSAEDLQGQVPQTPRTDIRSASPFDTSVPSLLPATDASTGFTGTRVPPDIDALVPPGTLTPTVDALPADQQQLAAETSEQQGTPFLQRLQDGRLAISRYVNDTWQPIASFGSDIITGTQQVYDELPAPVRNTIRTSGLVLGVAADPLGAVFGATVNGFQRALQTPALRPVVDVLQQASARGAQAWAQMQQNPVGRHVVGLWENTFGHPQFGQVASAMTTGAGRTFQAISNGGLGLLAAGAVTGETKIGSFVAGNPNDMPPELAQIYRQVAIVPRGMTIHYATVPVPGTPEGRVTLWTAGGSGMLMFPGLFQPGRTQPSAALNTSPSGRTEVNLWTSTVLSGPTAYGGLAVNLTPNIGIQRSAFVSLGSALVQTPVVRVGGTDDDALIPGRRTPWLDPKVIGSIQPVRIAFTDTVNFPLIVGDRMIPMSGQINRVRLPVAANVAGTVVNQRADGSTGVNPNLQVDFSRPPAVRNQTVIGLAPGGVPQADDLQQLRQIFGLDAAPQAPQLPPQQPESDR